MLFIYSLLIYSLYVNIQLLSVKRTWCSKRVPLAVNQAVVIQKQSSVETCLHVVCVCVKKAMFWMMQSVYHKQTVAAKIPEESIIK